MSKFNVAQAWHSSAVENGLRRGRRRASLTKAEDARIAFDMMVARPEKLASKGDVQ
jgi:hypothetical protein